MTVYVDQLMHHPSGRWCHMASDQSDLTELHEMAQKIGLKRSWFQNQNPRHPHYDLRPSKREAAVLHGAVEVDSFELVRRCSKLFNGDTKVVNNDFK